MEAKEFRVGNLLNYTTAEGDVLETSLDWQDFKWLEEDRKGFESVHDYIPLTEDWLIDFGFKFNDEDDAWQNHLLHIEERNEDRHLAPETRELLKDCFGVWLMHHNCFLREIKYAHQLQNLYFALTGKELTKKEQSKPTP